MHQQLVTDCYSSLLCLLCIRLPDSAKHRKRSTKLSRKRSSLDDDSSSSNDMLYNTGVATAVLDKYAIHHTRRNVAWLDGLPKHSNGNVYTGYNSSECSDSVWHDSAVYNSLRPAVTASKTLQTEHTCSVIQHSSKQCSDKHVQLLDTVVDSEQQAKEQCSLHDSATCSDHNDAVHDNSSSNGAVYDAATAGAIDNDDDIEVAHVGNYRAVNQLDTDSLDILNSVHSDSSSVNAAPTDTHEAIEAVPTADQLQDDATITINNADSNSNANSNSSHSICSSNSSKHVRIAATLQQLQRAENYNNSSSNTLQRPATTAAAATVSHVQAVAVGRWAMATVKTRKKERTGSVTVRNRPKSAPATRSTATSNSSSNSNHILQYAVRQAYTTTAATAVAGTAIGGISSIKQCTGGTQWDVKMLEVKARRELRDQQLVSTRYMHEIQRSSKFHSSCA
jgi:hypothetical protein